MTNRQIKSKNRVADHGEVFTNEREVKSMCNLVEQECERFDSRFLKPACGGWYSFTTVKVTLISSYTLDLSKVSFTLE